MQVNVLWIQIDQTMCRSGRKENQLMREAGDRVKRRDTSTQYGGSPSSLNQGSNYCVDVVNMYYVCESWYAN